MEGHHFFQSILTYLHLNPVAGDWFAFLVSFCESLPIVGTVVPGTITMTIVGVLMGNGTLPFFRTLTIISAAALAGDTIGYLIGFHYNERLRTMWPFKNHPKWLAMGEAFFAKHGGKSIIIGRFFGPARSTVPLIAGLLQLSWQRFLLAAIPSAILWAIMYITPGLLLGALSREIPKAETTRFFAYGIGTIIIIFSVIWLIQHFFMRITRGISRFTNYYWQSLTHKNSGKYIIKHIMNQQDPTDHHPLTMLLSAIITGFLFLITFINVRVHGIFTVINYPVFHLLQSIRTSFFDQFFTAVTIIGLPLNVLVIAILMSTYLLTQKQWRAATHLFTAAILSTLSTIVFKHLSHSVRPQGFEFVSPTSSFPSGHTTMSFVVFIFIAFLYAQITSKKLRGIPYALAGILVAAIAFSRLYLGAHWIDDIIGSLLLGTSILLVCIISYRRMPRATGAIQLSMTKAIFLVLLSFAIPTTFFMSHEFSSTLHHTTPTWHKKTISITSWWANPLSKTPLYRNNRFGEPILPLNVQWAGSIPEIESALKARGWETIRDRSKLKSTLARIGSFDAQYHMPILPWLYRQQPPVLVMIKHIQSRRRIIELRLWQSDLRFPLKNEPLLIGTTDIRIPPKVLLSLKERTTISLVDNTGLSALYADTEDFQRKYINSPTDPIPAKIKQLQWDGKILLIRNP